MDYELVISRTDIGERVAGSGSRADMMAFAKEDAEAEAEGKPLQEFEDGFGFGRYRWTVRPKS